MSWWSIYYKIVDHAKTKIMVEPEDCIVKRNWMRISNWQAPNFIWKLTIMLWIRKIPTLTRKVLNSPCNWSSSKNKGNAAYHKPNTHLKCCELVKIYCIVSTDSLNLGIRCLLLRSGIKIILWTVYHLAYMGNPIWYGIYVGCQCRVTLIRN